MADSKMLSPRAGTGSPPPNCAICLGNCINKCFSDSCMHEFCFKCLLEWSKIKAECPLCKQPFRSIIHDIKSANEYVEHIVEPVTTDDNLDNIFVENTASLTYLPPQRPPALHQYHFRTTFTVDTNGEHAIQQMLLSHPLLTIGSFTPDRYNHHRRRRGDTSTTFRRTIYNQNLWVFAPPDITGRYRHVSPSFFRNNPAARTRLVPWLNRELNALLYENTQQVMRLVDIIMDQLLRYHICSFMFRGVLYDYLDSKTDHFIHEFYNFMRSPFDMIGYDRNIIYTPRRPSPVSFMEGIEVSDYDSDVILVGESVSQTERSVTTDPVVIDLVETDSDEPIIVSEEHNASAVKDEPQEQRQTVLPLKLRLKNKHKAKERKRGKKRHRLIISSSSSTTSSDSSSSDSEHKKRQQKKTQKKTKKRKREYYVAKDDSLRDESSTDEEVSKRKSKSRRKGHSKDGDNEWASKSNTKAVKSKVKIRNVEELVKSEDKNGAGPSSESVRNVLKKEAPTSTQWYSRPDFYDSDSSEDN